MSRQQTGLGAGRIAIPGAHVVECSCLTSGRSGLERHSHDCLGRAWRQWLPLLGWRTIVFMCVCVLHALTSFEIRVLTAMEITGIDATQFTLVENRSHCLYSFQSIHSRCGISLLSIMNNPLKPEHRDRGEDHRSLCQFLPKWHIDSTQN